MPEILLLLVEDEALLVHVLEEELVEAGYTVQIAFDGPSAIKALEDSAQSFKALLTDIRLPGKITGWDIAHRARELSPTIPVIYMSGDSAADWRVNGVPESIMLAKPFAAAQAITAVSQLINAVPPAV